MPDFFDGFGGCFDDPFGGSAELVAFGRSEVFGGGFAVGTGEEEAAQVGDGVGEFSGQGEGVPEGVSAGLKGRGVGGGVDGLQDQVAEEEAGIEAGVAVVDDFEIDGHDAGGGDEEVLGGPVAVDEGDAAGAAGLDQRFVVGGAVRVAGGGEAVVGIEAEFVEDGLIAELGLPDGLLPGAFYDRAEGMAGGGGDGGIDLAAEEGGFPVGTGGGGGGHGVDAVGPVDEEDFGDGAGREERSDGLEGVGFAESAIGPGAPVGFDAELFERLFADDATAGGFGEENGIGDAAAQGGDGRPGGAGPLAFSEVGECVIFRQVEQNKRISGTAGEEAEEAGEAAAGVGFLRLFLLFF